MDWDGRETRSFLERNNIDNLKQIREETLRKVHRSVMKQGLWRG
jgi:hypothetical protein